MTEVDYSPEAYQRYMATRARVGDWAVDASAHRSQYTHPFQSHQPLYSPTSFGNVPEVRPSDSISVYNAPRGHDADRGRQRERERTRDLPRPTHSRSTSTPHPPASAPPPPSRRQAVSPGPLERHPSRSRADGTNCRTIDLNKYPVQGSEFRLPPLRAGETYMIIPPKGKRVEVVSAGGAHSCRIYSPNSSTSPTRHAAPRFLSPHAAHAPSRPRAVSPQPVTYAGHGGYNYVQPHGYVPHPIRPSYAPPGPLGLPAPARAKSPVKKPLLKRLLTGAGDKPRAGRRVTD